MPQKTTSDSAHIPQIFTNIESTRLPFIPDSKLLPTHAQHIGAHKLVGVTRFCPCRSLPRLWNCGSRHLADWVSAGVK